MPEKKIILFEGYCYVHNRIREDEIQKTKEKFPNAKVVVHPEAPMAVIKTADEVLSTSGMLRYVSESSATEFIVATEQGLLERMSRENPGKSFYPAYRPKICSNMKRTALIDVYHALNEKKYQIEIDPDVSNKAVSALNEMIKYI